MKLYRFLSDDDTSAFCHKVSAALDKGWQLHGNPTYGFDADYDIDDALKRLLEDGIVKQLPDGTLETLPPQQAATHIDALWDAYLDNLPDTGPRDGQEFDPRGLAAEAPKA